MSFVSGAAAAVTDRGKRHRHNEDAVDIAETPDGGGVLVVCDGVSSTSGSAEASLRAASAARDLLVVGLTPTDEDEDQIVANAEELLVRAVEEAQSQASASADVQAAEEAAGGAEVNPIHDGGSPSSTFVAVVAKPVDDGIALTTAWVGDSRAYWVGSTAQRLTGDDHELGGSLVRWLGADTINATPEIVTTVVPAGGHVFVCSDGLWRYAAEPQELSELTERLLSDGHLGVDLATAMVAFANERGGHDNISVALWTDNQDLIGPAEPTPAEPQPVETTPAEPPAVETTPAEPVPTDVDLTDADPADPDPTTVEAENSAPQPHLEDGGDGQ